MIELGFVLATIATGFLLWFWFTSVRVLWHAGWWFGIAAALIFISQGALS